MLGSSADFPLHLGQLLQKPTIFARLPILSLSSLPLLLCLPLHRIHVPIFSFIQSPCPLRPWPNWYLLMTRLPFPTSLFHTHTPHHGHLSHPRVLSTTVPGVSTMCWTLVRHQSIQQTGPLFMPSFPPGVEGSVTQ